MSFFPVPLSSAPLALPTFITPWVPDLEECHHRVPPSPPSPYTPLTSPLPWEHTCSSFTSVRSPPLILLLSAFSSFFPLSDPHSDSRGVFRLLPDWDTARSAAPPSLHPSAVLSYRFGFVLRFLVCTPGSRKSLGLFCRSCRGVLSKPNI